MPPPPCGKHPPVNRVACARLSLYLPPHLPPSISMPALGACGLSKFSQTVCFTRYFSCDSSFTFPDADLLLLVHLRMFHVNTEVTT